MLATLIRPDAGDALLEGRSIVKEPEECAAHRLFDQRTEAGGLLFALVPVRFFRPAARAFPAGARRAQGGTVRYIWHWRIRRREGGEPFHRHEAKGRPGHIPGARPGYPDLRRADQRAGRAHRQSGNGLSARAAAAGQNADRFHAHLQPDRKNLRPGGRDHRRQDGRGRHAAGGVRRAIAGGRFFAIYAQTVGEEA